jgi:hypothetical protein
MLLPEGKGFHPSRRTITVLADTPEEQIKTTARIQLVRDRREMALGAFQKDLDAMKYGLL